MTLPYRLNYAFNNIQPLHFKIDNYLQSELVRAIFLFGKHSFKEIWIRIVAASMFLNIYLELKRIYEKWWINASIPTVLSSTQLNLFFFEE